MGRCDSPGALSFLLLQLGFVLRELGDLRIVCTICKSFFFDFSKLLCVLTGMACVKITAKEISEGASSPEEKDHFSGDKEDLSNVDADPSELMKKDKPAPTLRFGPSLMSAALIESYVERG